MKVGLTSVRTSRGFLSKQCCRCHLSSRHAIDGIVDKDGSYVLTTVEGMDGFAGSDTSQVAITLIGKDEAVGPKTFYC